MTGTPSGPSRSPDQVRRDAVPDVVSCGVTAARSSAPSSPAPNKSFVLPGRPLGSKGRSHGRPKWSRRSSGMSSSTLRRASATGLRPARHRSVAPRVWKFSSNAAHSSGVSGITHPDAVPDASLGWRLRSDGVREQLIDLAVESALAARREGSSEVWKYRCTPKGLLVPIAAI